MEWLFDSDARPTFRICNCCGAVFHVFDGDAAYHYCPACGEKEKEVEGVRAQVGRGKKNEREVSGGYQGGA